MNYDFSKFIFIKPDPTLRSNLMAFGFECGSGWEKLIYDCFTRIYNYLYNTDKTKLYEFEILQVKEKYGTLRIYTNFIDDVIFDIISYYENLSGGVCEVCGKYGILEERNGWLRTRCNDHKNTW